MADSAERLYWPTIFIVSFIAVISLLFTMQVYYEPSTGDPASLEYKTTPMTTAGGVTYTIDNYWSPSKWTGATYSQSHSNYTINQQNGTAINFYTTSGSGFWNSRYTTHYAGDIRNATGVGSHTLNPMVWTYHGQPTGPAQIYGLVIRNGTAPPTGNYTGVQWTNPNGPNNNNPPYGAQQFTDFIYFEQRGLWWSEYALDFLTIQNNQIAGLNISVNNFIIGTDNVTVIIQATSIQGFDSNTFRADLASNHFRIIVCHADIVQPGGGGGTPDVFAWINTVYQLFTFQLPGLQHNWIMNALVTGTVWIATSFIGVTMVTRSWDVITSVGGFIGDILRAIFRF